MRGRGGGGVRLRFGLPLVAALLGLTGPALEMPPASGAGKPPAQAVVLITVDTLRADSVSFDGYERRTTPNLDKLAASGVVFGNARAPAAWTPPSMASLMTSLYPSSHGVTGAVVEKEGRPEGRIEQTALAASLTTLAESLKAAGYLTLGVPANRHLAARLGFAQGYDHYYDEADFLRANAVNVRVRAMLRQAFGSSWRSAWKQRRTFLWVHYFDPHDPYYANQPWMETYAPGYLRNRGRYPAGLAMAELEKRYPVFNDELARVIRPLYDSEISFVDHEIGQLAGELGFDDPDVLVIFTADHGEEILDHGDLGHALSLYEELLHVPLFVRWPRRLATRARSEAAVSLLDVYPSLLELLGLPAVEGLQGRSLVPLLDRRSPRPAGATGQGPLFFQLDPPKGALLGALDGSSKLIWNYGSGRRELYDLAADPREHRDLAAARPEEVRRLEQLTRRWVRSLPPPPPAEVVESVDPALREQLRALGYIDG